MNKKLDELVLRLSGDGSVLMSDPLQIAAETAFAAIGSMTESRLQYIYTAIIEAAPRNSTDFERGLALGIALMLATEPDAMHRHLDEAKEAVAAYVDHVQKLLKFDPLPASAGEPEGAQGGTARFGSARFQP